MSARPSAGPAAAPWPDGRDALERWWSSARRRRDELPWRVERDPWRTLVAETMLTQTQASRVAARYPVVVDALATPASTAALTVAELLALWSGLGYYRRAIALHRCAATIEDRHGGVVPRDLGALLALPGVGEYTARAVLAFAYGQPVGVLDTNTRRVIARAFVGAQESPTTAQRTADRLVAGNDPRDWNLAVMDLGALVCTARAPACTTCPLAAAGACAWRSSSEPSDPARSGARGSAGFAGSDRQYRGRLLRALGSAPAHPAALGGAIGLEADRARVGRLLAALIAEGMVEERGDGAVGLAGWDLSRT